MSESLNDQYIADTFTGLLHSDGSLVTTGQSPIFDGNGTQSALSLGKTGNGASVSGVLSVDNATETNSLKVASVTYPINNATVNDLVFANTAEQLAFISYKNFIAALGGFNGNGTYTAPTITFQNGVITDIESAAAVTAHGIRTFTNVGSGSWKVPSGVTSVKFYVTGGGASGGFSCGGAGATVIGYLPVTSGQVIGYVVGQGGVAPTYNGTQSSISLNGDTLVTANGGRTGVFAHDGTSAAQGKLTSDGENIIGNNRILIRGGHGEVDTDEAQEDSIGGSSFWGTAPAYGGASGATEYGPYGPGGNGVVIFEW